MNAALAVYFSVTVGVGTLLAVFIPTLNKKRMGTNPGAVQMSGGLRGSTMEKIAGSVVMFLGQLTIAVLHQFEKLGVDMSAFDEALARLTAFTSGQASSLREANATNAAQAAEIDRLVTTDAEEDRRQIADAIAQALAEAAQQVDQVVDNLENPPADEDLPDTPADPAPEDPGTPALPTIPVEGDGGPLDPSLPVTPVDPVGDPVVSDPEQPGVPGDLPNEVPPVTPEEPPVVDTPVVVEPEADPVPAGDLPSDTPVVEAPDGPIAEVPTDAEVVNAGDVAPETPVVEVQQDPTAGQ